MLSSFYRVAEKKRWIIYNKKYHANDIQLIRPYRGAPYLNVILSGYGLLWRVDYPPHHGYRLDDRRKIVMMKERVAEMLNDKRIDLHGALLWRGVAPGEFEAMVRKAIEVKPRRSLS